MRSGSAPVRRGLPHRPTVVLATIGVIAATGAVSAPASAAEPAGGQVPALAQVEEARASAVGETDSRSAKHLTVPGGANQVVGDVLRYGYEQVVRLSGSQVEIVDSAADGGTVLKRFEAGTEAEWPKNGWNPVYYGQSMLDGHHSASRVAVLDDVVYVSTLDVITDEAGVTKPDGSTVRSYTTNGELIETHRFEGELAVTSLDAYRHQGHAYLAVGLNTTGVRVLEAEESGMPEVQQLHLDWGGRHDGTGSVLNAKLGVDTDGRLLVVAGRMTTNAHAVVAADVTTGEDVWSNNLVPRDHFHATRDIAFGAFGPDGRRLVAIAWSTLPRVSFVDAATGADWTYVDRGYADVVRFYENGDGENRVAINASESIIGGVDEDGAFEEIATAPRFQLPWLIRQW